MEQSLDVLDLIINQMKLEISNNLKKQYKNYRIDDEIDKIVDELLESDIDFSKINKNYKKPVNKMIIEKDPINYDKCLARRLNGGYGGQCTRYKLKGSKYCKNHQTEEQRWCGLITENRKEKFYLINDKGCHLHKWKN